MANGEPKYSADTSSLIAAWRERYPIRNFPPFWTRMEQALDERLIVISREIYDEVRRKDEELFEWLEPRADCVVEVDDSIQVHVATIMANYPKLVDTRTGKSGADPWVIALAMTYNPKLTVVTEENKGGSVDRPKIPFVCGRPEIQVQSLNLLGLIQAENWVF